MPDLYCYSHSISRIFYVHAQNQREQSSKSLTSSQPRAAEPFNNLQTSYPATEKDYEWLILFLIVVGQILSYGLLSFLLKISADFTQTTTIDVRGFFAISLDRGSFCIFYNRMNRGPKYNFVSSPAFGEVTGDDSCWNLIIPRSPRSLVQLWASLLGIKHPESML